MSKLVKNVLSLPLLFGLMFTAGCDMENLLVSEQPENSIGDYDEVTQLNQIYELAKAQGYEGTYEDWINSLKGDQIELRISLDGTFIQWRYSSSYQWHNLIPLSQITGENGKDGQDGLTPYIGENGNWWIGENDTGIAAHGKGDDGQDGVDGVDGKDGQDGKDGVDGKDGQDGLTPFIGENGNWWIGENDTGIAAHGKGDDGKDGLTPFIGENGNWWIGETDTQVKAESKGDKGDTGKSAYEAFIETHPEYQGDESQWLEDLLNGKLSESNYKYYDVVFNLEGGEFTTIDFDLEQEILATHAVECPSENPTKPGYIFAGWYVGNNKWNFDSNVVLKNIVINARWVKANVDPRVEINDVTSDYDSIFFDLYIDNISEVDTIVLYRHGELIQTLDNLDIRQFDGLLSNQDYQLEVTFSYDLNDGYGRQTETTNCLVNTKAKQYPTFNFNNVCATTDSLSFTLNEFDPDEAAEFTNYELYLEGEKVAESFDITSTNFVDLLANKDYVLRANYECDMNDLSKPYTNYVEYNIKTLELFAPVVTLNNQFTTQNTITGQIIINDKSQINNFICVQLYKGDELIETSKSFDLTYTNLDYNTTYTIVVVHEYDLRDGKGVVRKETSFDITTHPIYSLSSTEILNTSAIVEGELVYIHAEVNNPSNAVFTKMVINDIEYDVDPASTATHVFAYIPSVELGNTLFTVNKLIAEIDGSEFEYYAEDNNTATATVYDRMEIKSVNFIDKDFNERNYFFQNEEKYIQFNLNNPSGYTLTEVVIDNFTFTADDLIRVDNNTYYALYNYGDENNFYSYTLSSYSYANEIVSRRTNTTFKTDRVCILSSDIEKTYISSIEDLLAISKNYNEYGYRYYELTNDIDLSGIEWIPIDIRGVLNGNGYSIKNLRIAKTYENSSMKIAFASNLRGVLENLTLDSMFIMADFINSDSEYCKIGSLVAEAEYSIIDNCHVLNNSSLSIRATNIQAHVGGLVGRMYGCTIKNSSINGNVSITKKDSDISAGMFAGGDDESTYYNSFITGNMFFVDKNDSISRPTNWSNRIRMENCYNTGALNGNYDVSLFENSSYVTSINSLSLGTLYPNQVLDLKTIQTYTFETNGGNELESIEGSIINLPTPTKQGYYFLGWYDNEDLSGKPVSGTYFNKENITLYARWAKIIDFSSSMISNDENHPFEFRDGVLTSTIHERDNNEDYVLAKYEIVADRSIRVYFYDRGIYSTNSSGNVHWVDNSNSLKYVDLEAGQYLNFEIWAYNDDRPIGYVENLVIVEM